MISRRTATALGEVYEAEFTYYYNGGRSGKSTFTLYKDKLYDFLYDNDYDAWFCNKVKKLPSVRRSVKEFVMKTHTGETQYSATPDWIWQQRITLGQRYLYNLSDDILKYWESKPKNDGLYTKTDTSKIDKLISNLELDGYIYRNSRLLTPESDVLDVVEEAHLLETMYKSLGLRNQDLVLHHLSLSEEHYIAKKWDDSISNSRKFLECVLQEVSVNYNLKIKGSELPKNIYTKPVEIRDYLEREGLLETKEKETLRTTYGLLSHTGGHPYMAQNDQARLLRHLALTFSQFVMLRLEGALKKHASISSKV
jgi:hypothetical protein